MKPREKTQRCLSLRISGPNTGYERNEQTQGGSGLRDVECSPGGLQDALQVEILQTCAASDERTQTRKKHQE